MVDFGGLDKGIGWPGGGVLAHAYPLEFAPVTAMRGGRLVELRDWFQSRVRDGKTLDLSEFNWDTLRNFLDIVSLVDLRYQSDRLVDYSVVISSPMIQSVFGDLPEGSAYHSFPPAYFHRWKECFNKVIGRKGPIYCRSRAVYHDNLYRLSECIMMPLMDGDRVTKVISGNLLGPVKDLNRT